MTEANKDEADKCKQIAMSAAASGDTDKATRFLQKAKRMCPDDASIDELLAKVASGDFERSSAGSGPSPSAAGAPNSEGTRQRASATSSARSAPQASSGARADKAGRNYTTEQFNDVQRILRTKDYYEIFGLSRDAGEDVVKKAYKKLALKLHPDKNKAPGAEEAFKKISKAVQCLTDQEKKHVYDRYGDEDHVPRSQRHHHYQQDFMTPEDLFNAFFGGGAFHTQHHNHGHHGHDDNQVQRAQLMQIMPIALIVLLTLASNLTGRHEGSRFSFSPNGQYVNERSTANLNIPYYVPNDFEDHYAEGTRALADFEKQVDIYYIRNLHSECDHQEKVMYKKVMLAKRKNDPAELEKARAYPRPACKDLEKIKRRHGNIYRVAMQMGY
eukprot:TRINITY_DN55880_c0_g1_i1.p1 TRINITY_DN55880_c0_g1~~TRINITY_DN55880_c0_g1_i1.p1  ORF type:complete len:419 (-),score=76.84 TRINITY_DN55880_c0_g1_i1:154-1308(-)